jgi:hypothetical protein
MRLGNRTNLDEAQRRGIEVRVAQADQHARNVLPVIREVQTRSALAGGDRRRAERARCADGPR